jgi:alpha-beta hydrolase superfamily lysophospholipase
VRIAHGFAGSQQLMQPFALTLSRNGYAAVNFDFPGHGRNSAPMRGGLADAEASQRVLLATMNELAGFAVPRAAGATVAHPPGRALPCPLFKPWSSMSSVPWSTGAARSPAK